MRYVLVALLGLLGCRDDASVASDAQRWHLTGPLDLSGELHEETLDGEAVLVAHGGCKGSWGGCPASVLLREQSFGTHDSGTVPGVTLDGNRATVLPTSDGRLELFVANNGSTEPYLFVFPFGESRIEATQYPAEILDLPSLRFYRCGDWNGDGLVDAGTPEGTIYLSPISADSVPAVTSNPEDGIGCTVGDWAGEGPQRVFSSWTEPDGDLVLRWAEDTSSGVLQPTSAPQAFVDIPAGSNRKAVGDLDGDGDDDLVLMGVRSRLAVYIDTDEGPFGEELFSLDLDACDDCTEFSSSRSVVAADFDGDGISDLAMAQLPVEDRGTVHVWRGPLSSSTTFDDAIVWRSRCRAGSGSDGFGWEMATLDLENDGRPGLAVSAPDCDGGGAVFYLETPLG